MFGSANTEGQRHQRRALSAEVFLFCFVVLYLSVSPSVFLLRVWGRQRNGRELSSQSFTSLYAPSSAFWPK